MKRILIAVVAAVALISCGPESLTFVHMSDPQVGFRDKTEGYSYSDSLFKQAVAAVNRIEPKLVVITGDLVNNAQNASQKDVYTRNIAEISPKIKVYALPGNHDMRPWTRENYDNFLEFNGYDRFSFTEAGCAFIGFDSCCIKDGIEEQEADQLVWLKEQLKAAQGSRYIFLFCHCPIFRESIDEDEDYFNFSKPKRQEYLEFFKEYGVNAVFAGHTHKAYSSSWDGIQLITAGPVGTPLDGGISGINVVRVDRNGFTCAFSAPEEAK